MSSAFSTVTGRAVSASLRLIEVPVTITSGTTGLDTAFAGGVCAAPTWGHMPPAVMARHIEKTTLVALSARNLRQSPHILINPPVADSHPPMACEGAGL